MNLLTECIAHHRNGICGAPFHAVLFRDPDEGRMLGVVFDLGHHVAVFHLDKLAQGNIAFGVNSWRGDRYEPHLRRLIRNQTETVSEYHPAVSPTILPPLASDLLTALRRAVAALNRVPAFRTDEGISSYQLLPQLEAILQRATTPTNGKDSA